MAEAILRPGESQEGLLKRFQRMVQIDGILRDAKARRHYIPPGEAARMKSRNAAKRRRRQRY